MNKLQLSGAALVIGAAAMFSMTPVFAEDAPPAPAAPVEVCTLPTPADAAKPAAEVPADKKECEKAGGIWGPMPMKDATTPDAAPAE